MTFLTVTPTGIAPDDATVVWWRARAVGSDVSDWTAPASFTVGTPDTTSVFVSTGKTGEFIVTTNGIVTAVYATTWDGTSWSPYIRVL